MVCTSNLTQDKTLGCRDRAALLLQKRAIQVIYADELRWGELIEEYLPLFTLQCRCWCFRMFGVPFKKFNYAKHMIHHSTGIATACEFVPFTRIANIFY